MIAIKDMEMPKGCQRCRYFQKHLFGNGLDYSYSCLFGATEFPYPWIRQMEERASDCPLIELEERKVGKWIKTGGSFRCSECVVMPEFKDIRRLKYCPNCGAEMKGYENG